MNKNNASVALSVNLNKIALIRNSRPGNNPDIVDYAKKILSAGADGLTVHPRPDQRHIRPEDCYQLKTLAAAQGVELNIEGNPFAGPCPSSRNDFSNYPGFLDILAQAKPEQATLVPDSDAQLTSDHGFDLSGDTSQLENIIQRIHALNCRVSLFMDPDIDQINYAKAIGADRIELYTGPYADAYENNSADSDKLFKLHCQAAEHASSIGLGVNAGHDLNLDNLQQYRDLPGLLEVSIGHALTLDSLEMGMAKTIDAYCQLLHHK